MLNNEKLSLVLILILIYIISLSNTIYAFFKDTDTRDIPKSSDHSLISRFPDSYIRFYETKNYDKYTVSLSNLPESEDKDAVNKNLDIVRTNN